MLIKILSAVISTVTNIGAEIIGDYKTNSEIIRPIFPISTFPLNSNLAVKLLENITNNSESGIISPSPGVWMEKY